MPVHTRTQQLCTSLGEGLITTGAELRATNTSEKFGFNFVREFAECRQVPVASQINALLKGAFDAHELTYLIEHQRFKQALASCRMVNDFEDLCIVAENLLAEWEAADPAVELLRLDARRSRQPES